MPARVSPDHLTIAGIMGSIIAAAGYIGTNWSLQWLWLASAGLAINWGGDSLDGTVARLRKIERPHYGFFVDKTADLTSKTVLFLGLALSPCIRFTLCATALIALQIASVYALVSAVIGGTHRITHAVGQFAKDPFFVLRDVAAAIEPRRLGLGSDRVHARRRVLSRNRSGRIERGRSDQGQDGDNECEQALGARFQVHRARTIRSAIVTDQ